MKIFMHLALLSLLVLGLASAALGQKTLPSPKEAPTDKCQVTDFSITPTPPRQGQLVTIKMTIKNVSNTTLKIPWKITRNDQVWSGAQEVKAGDSFSPTVTWSAALGAQHFVGTADPDNTLGEVLNQRNNNSKSLDVNVAQVSASTEGTGGSQPRLVTQTLNHVNAKYSGASFTINAVGATPCTLESNGGISMPTWSDEIPAFRISCTGGPVGGRADFEAYLGFTLKNGWKIKSYEIAFLDRGGDSGCDWDWRSTPPSQGSTNPYLKWRLWANGGSRITVGIKIIIEGPEGTNPYR